MERKGVTIVGEIAIDFDREFCVFATDSGIAVNKARRAIG